MSDPNLLSQVAELLRPVSKEVSNGRGKLCLSTVYLQKLNNAFDENVPEELTSSFHLTEAKANFQRDLLFLLDLIKGTICLKITPDLVENEESNTVTLKRFKNIKILEIHKVDIKNVLGIQRLRSQLQELTCTCNLEILGDILNRCGGDFSLPNLWGELKKANFSHNHISDIDDSFQFTPWLNTLDLSYNTLTNVQFINNLPNLKNLNLSFNKLVKVPKFKGQICKRLQNLILKNNFIEDLSGLSSLSNLSQLDLNQNCIIDHKMFRFVSHMDCLYFFNLQGNPVNCHPHHRTLTCNYLNKNAATLKFVLDNMLLNKSEKALVGSHHPIAQGPVDFNDSSSQSSIGDISVKLKKTRIVAIQEGYDGVGKPENTTPISTPRACGHLEVKNQIETLREEYGTSWLTKHSGKKVQDALGVFSSTPLGNNSGSVCSGDISFLNESDATDNLTFHTASTHLETKEEVPNEGRVQNEKKEHNGGVEKSKGGEQFEGGEQSKEGVQNERDLQNERDVQNEEEVKNKAPDVVPWGPIEPVRPKKIDSEEDDHGEIFFAASVPDSQEYNYSLVVTKTCLLERDIISGDEKASWHVNVIKVCKPGERPNEVQIVFNTQRSDRKSRTYYLDEAENFIKTVYERMVELKVPEKRIQYQCMKCNELFSRTKVSGVLVNVTVSCPRCESNAVIESK